MRSRTATATAVAAGLTYAAGGGFFGPMTAGNGIGRPARQTAPETADRWVGGRRWSRRGTVERLNDLRGGASGGKWFDGIARQAQKTSTSCRD